MSKFLGSMGAAARSIGAGHDWIEIFKTTIFEGYCGMLVFFTFMPLGIEIGGIAGAVLFCLLAMRDGAIASTGAPSPAGPVNYGSLL